MIIGSEKSSQAAIVANPDFGIIRTENSSAKVRMSPALRRTSLLLGNYPENYFYP